MDIRDYFEGLEAELDEIARDGSTVEKVIEILNQNHLPSSGDAFFPGGMDRTLYDVLFDERDDWEVVWCEADYYWCGKDSTGALLSFTEGDVDRGDAKAPAKATG